MKTKAISLAALGAAVLAVSGCTSNGGGGAGGPGGTLPIQASGKMLGFRLPGTATSEINDFTNTPQVNTTATGVRSVDRTAQGGVGISGSITEDPNPNQNQAGGPTLAALVSASADAPMVNGATFIGLDEAKGNVYFENGNFGDPQAESAEAAISTVSVYNISQQQQINLKDSTTIRYRDGVEGDGFVNFGVGYVGNQTAAMPGSGTATYTGFWEQGAGHYDTGDGVAALVVSGDAQLEADFAAGTVNGRVQRQGGVLLTFSSLGENPRNPNENVEALEISGNITGSEYAGTSRFVDAQGQQVGQYSQNEMIGAFFGANARETIAVTQVEGSMELDGENRDFVMQGVIGAVKQ